ncbi:MAG: MopE-related protein [Acidobacteriota bacterium]|nr:MopE-related protein [Acidobacteriota bacterium]
MSARPRSRCRRAAVTWAVLALAAAFLAHGDTVFESFEDGFGPWRAGADTPLGWYIVPSEDQSLDGSSSLDFSANGMADDGTLWAVRELQLPAGTWNVTLEFHVYSFSGGIIGAWPAIGFIGLYEPLTEEDFTQSSAGEDFGAIGQQGWQSFTMQRTLQVSQPTTAWVAFGYNIVFEVTRTHFFDSVTLSGVPLQCGNGTCFAGEDPCNCPADCGPPAGVESACDDGLDDDCDGFTDCVDAECKPDSVCAGIACDGDGACEAGESPCDCLPDCGPPDLLETICDDGLDNDCNSLVDCADGQFCSVQPPCFGCVVPPNEVSPPGSAEPLLFSDDVTLVWEAAGTSLSDTFSLYRGSVADLPAGYGTCLESAIPSNTMMDLASPPSGVSWLYLVTGENCLGEGIMGRTSSGEERTNGSPCP